MRGLTPETEWRLHLTKAREFWLEDRLDAALAAMKLALRTGIPPGDWYDLQRTIEAEWGARRAACQVRLAEHLVVEMAPRSGDPGRTIRQVIVRSFREVSDALAVLWGEPVLVTLIPEEEWLEFMHARYGYYARRDACHKVCLPPSALRPPGRLARAARHEIAHAATHQIAGESVPPWLDEGIAVLMEEDGFPMRYAGPPLRLDEVSGGFESFQVDIGGELSGRCYAAAGDFAAGLAQSRGMCAVRRLLAELRAGRSIERGFGHVFGVSLRSAEQRWMGGSRPI